MESHLRFPRAGFWRRRVDERQELLIKKTKHELKAAIAEIELENLELREENERLRRRLEARNEGQRCE